MICDAIMSDALPRVVMPDQLREMHCPPTCVRAAVAEKLPYDDMIHPFGYDFYSSMMA